MTIQHHTVKAEFIKPGDFLEGKEVLWVIPSGFIRHAHVEVRLAPLGAHNTKYIKEGKSVEIVRLVVS